MDVVINCGPNEDTYFLSKGMYVTIETVNKFYIIIAAATFDG